MLEKTGPDSVKAEIHIKMGAMSLKFNGTVEIAEQEEAHRVVMKVKSKEVGGQGYANADVVFAWRAAGRSTPGRRSPVPPRRWGRAWSRASWRR